MRETEQSTPTRRAVLSTIGTGLTAGVLGTEAMAQQDGSSQFALEQGGGCVAVQPLRGQLLADEFYDFQLPEQYVTAANGAFVGDDAMYSSAGTTDLQRAQTSIAFLYRDPSGLYLVVVHGSVEAPDAGAVTFQISGLPEDGEWIVKDDLYRDPETGEIADTNYDRWDIDGATHRIDWTWGSSGTDGGVFGDLGDDFEIVIEPAFNEAAALYGEHYEGTITDWEFVSGLDGGERFSLDLDEPIRIRTGSCAGESPSRGTTRGTDQQQVEQEQEVEVEQEQNTSEQETERNQQNQGNQQEGEQSQQQDVEQSQQDDDAEQSQEAEIEQEQETEGDQERDEDDEDNEDDEDDEDDDDEDEEEEREAEEEEDDDEDDEDDDDDDERGRGNGNGRGDERGQGRGNEERGDDDDEDEVDGDDEDD